MIPTEIERKFLLELPKDTTTKKFVDSLSCGTDIRQGYLPTAAGVTARVRLCEDHHGEPSAFLTIKGKREGLGKPEFEYPIPPDHAKFMLNTLCVSQVKKTRYLVYRGPHILEVDVFKGHLKGLIVIEVEVKSEKEKIDLPSWVGREVSRDRRYSNKKMSVHGIPTVKKSKQGKS